MLQRIQTIYLFLASCCWLIIFILPRFGIEFSLGTNEIVPNYDVILLSIIFYILLITSYILTPILNFIAIFFYKKRNRQIKICNVAIVSSVCFLLSLFFICLSENTEINYSAFISPVISLIFTILAIKAIKKDEKLINSADRLR